MPKLLIFAPFERVIVDQRSNTLSAICLLEQVQTPTPPAELPVPDGPMLAPMRWSILAVWLREPEDEGVQYEQRLELIGPDGTRSIEGTSSFALGSSRTHRVMTDVPWFPVSVPGEYLLRLSFHLDGEEDWQLAHEYPILLIHTPEPDAQVQPEPAIH